MWDAFGDGLIDFARVRDIAATIDQLKREESIARLDRLVVAYAVDHTAAELRAWLRRFVQRVEADLAVERADDERRSRHVSVKHGPDSMGTLYAYLPSHELAAIEARLRKAARRQAEPGDERTVAQREADQLVAWCTGSEAANSAVDANIAVTIPADVLAGAVAGFAESTDGRWAVPAAWVAAVIGTGTTFWHRIVTDPVTDDILSHESPGRWPQPWAERSEAGAWAKPSSDEVAGTASAASRAPHREPWPDGPTTAGNLGPLCRRHHQMKGHGALRWSTRPPRPPKLLVVEIWRDPVDIEYAGQASMRGRTP